MIILTETRHFRSDFDKLPKKIQIQVRDAIALLAESPANPDASLRHGKIEHKKFQKKFGPAWRIKVGKYRIVYRPSETELALLLIGHRSDFYRQLGKML